MPSVNGYLLMRFPFESRCRMVLVDGKLKYVNIPGVTYLQRAT